MTVSYATPFDWRALGPAGTIGPAAVLPGGAVSFVPGSKTYTFDGEYVISDPAPIYGPDDDPIPLTIAVSTKGIEIEVDEVQNRLASLLLGAARLVLVVIGLERRLLMYSKFYRIWLVANWTNEVDQWLRTAAYLCPFDEPEDPL